jgi:hypothetical protein
VLGKGITFDVVGNYKKACKFHMRLVIYIEKYQHELCEVVFGNQPSLDWVSFHVFSPVSCLYDVM